MGAPTIQFCVWLIKPVRAWIHVCGRLLEVAVPKDYPLCARQIRFATLVLQLVDYPEELMTPHVWPYTDST